jgi:hypothetical protein
VIRYEAALKADKFVVIASGTATDVGAARVILSDHHGQAQIHGR